MRGWRITGILHLTHDSQLLLDRPEAARPLLVYIRRKRRTPGRARLHPRRLLRGQYFLSAHLIKADINDLDIPKSTPSCFLDKFVLASLALAIELYLGRCGLTDINHGPTPQKRCWKINVRHR